MKRSIRLSYDEKNYADIGGCYLPRVSYNTLLDLHNSLYHTQPQSMIINYTFA